MTVKNIILAKHIKNKLQAFLGVEDIFLFGSFVRGKVAPRDIDVLVLFVEKVDKHVELEIRNILLPFYPSLSIVSKTKKTALDPAFDARESILFEGKSLFTGKSFAERYGFSCFGLFRYDIHTLTALQKTKFYYALQGRLGAKGMLDALRSFKFSDMVILTPLEKIEPMKDFLDSWKIPYQYIPVLLPQRMSSLRILQK